MAVKRQHFNQFGKPKRSYYDHATAIVRRDLMIKETGWAYQVYKCEICKAFHIGNKEYWRVRRSQTRREEMMAGKLVHALRLVLDH